MGQRLTFSLRLNSWRGRAMQRERERAIGPQKIGKFSLMWHSHFFGGLFHHFTIPSCLCRTSPLLTATRHRAGGVALALGTSGKSTAHRSRGTSKGGWRPRKSNRKRIFAGFVYVFYSESNREIMFLIFQTLEIQDFSGYFMSGHGRP